MRAEGTFQVKVLHPVRVLQICALKEVIRDMHTMNPGDGH